MPLIISALKVFNSNCGKVLISESKFLFDSVSYHFCCCFHLVFVEVFSTNQMHYKLNVRSETLEDDFVSVITTNTKKSLLAIAFISGKLLIKNLNTFETKIERYTHNSKILSLIISNDGNSVFSSDISGFLINFNLKNQETKLVGSGNGRIKQLLINEENLISVCDSEVIFWDLQSFEKQNRLSFPNNGWNCINNTENELILISCYDVFLVDLKTKELKKKISLNKFNDKIISSNHQNCFLVSRRRYGLSSIFEFDTSNSMIKNITQDESDYSNIYIHENLLYIVREDGLIRIADSSSLEILYKLEFGNSIKSSFINESEKNVTIVSYQQNTLEDGENEITFNFLAIVKLLDVIKILKRKRDLNLNFRFRYISN